MRPYYAIFSGIDNNTAFKRLYGEYWKKRWGHLMMKDTPPEHEIAVAFLEDLATRIEIEGA